MVFAYDDQNDDFTYNIYRVSWIVILTVGILAIAWIILQSGLDVSLDFIETLSNNILEIVQVTVFLSVAALLVGFITVGFAAKLGEEIVLLVTWVTPFLVIAVSLYIFQSTQQIDYLGGTVAGVIFLAIIFYFRKSVRLSARLIEVGAEITATNPSLFIPQLTAFMATVIFTALFFPGMVFIVSFTYKIHVIVTIFAIGILSWMYTFVVSAFQSFADASNIAYINYWYSGSSSKSLGSAADKVKGLRAPIVRFSFLMAFIARFRRSGRQSKWNPLRLFELMKFSNWKNVLLRGRSITSTAANIAAYFGAYTLVVIVVDNMKSVASAYKKSAQTTFERFVENIAGSMGFNILESIRKFITFVLMAGAGGFYGYTTYNDVVIAIIFAFFFVIMGFYPVNSMFKPVINAYRLILYRAHTGKISKELDNKTQQLIKEVVKS